MNKDNVSKHIDFYVLDIVSLLLCFCFSYYLRHKNFMTVDLHIYLEYIVFMILVNVVSTYVYMPYKNVLKRGYLKELKTTFEFIVIQMLLMSFILVISKSSSNYSRIVFVVTYVMYFVLSYLIRTIYKKYLINKSSKAIDDGKKSLLVITNKKNLEKTINDIKEYNFNLYRINGICILDSINLKDKIKSFNVVANKKNVLEYACRNWVDEVYFALDYNSIPKEIIKGFATIGIKTHIRLQKIEELQGQQQNVEKLFDSPVLTSCIRPRTNLEIFLKRLMDIFGGLVGSLIALFLALFIGPAIYFRSPGPIFFKQERIGLNGKHFYMFKFRSMIMNADDKKKELLKDNIMEGALFKIENDPRIIPGIGNFIRKTSLDEFPQFFNVLKGEMSLVGTRPPTLDEWEKYKLEQRIRMSIKPGITGIWQTSGRNKITDFNKVVEMDREYINNWSLGLDIKILFKTVYVLLFRKDDGAM